MACLAGALPAAVHARPRVTGARAEVRKADAARCGAVAGRDLEGFLLLLADDVAFFPDDRPVSRGREAVRVLLAPFFDPKGPSLRCEPLTAEVARSGDMAYTTGTYDERGTEAERSPTRGHGKYVTLWRRRAGGPWRIAVDIGNAEPLPERDFGPPPRP